MNRTVYYITFPMLGPSIQSLSHLLEEILVSLINLKLLFEGKTGTHMEKPKQTYGEHANSTQKALWPKGDLNRGPSTQCHPVPH